MMIAQDQREAGVEDWLIRFRSARRKVGLTLPMLAKMVGMDVTTLHRYETGGNVGGCPDASRQLMEDALARWQNPRYRERLEAVCLRWKFGPRTVAAMSGVPEGTLHHICYGETVLPRNKNREKLDAWLERWEKTLTAANDTAKVAKAS